MAKADGLFAYLGYLQDEEGRLAGGWRGAAEPAERRGWTPNNAVKMAEKRALVDAVLRTAALSELFTQDLEDASRRVSRPLTPGSMISRQPYHFSRKPDNCYAVT